MISEHDLRTDKFTLAEGGTVYVLTHLPSRISARDESFEKSVIQRMANLRKRLDVCVNALAQIDCED